MTPMTLTSLIIVAVSFLAALLSSWMLLVPFFSEADPSAAAVGRDGTAARRAELLEQKERLFQALEELEQEHLAGKIPTDLYTASKSELTVEAAECMAKLAETERQR